MIVKVNVDDQPDGNVHVSSEDLPGLMLSGRDKTKIIAAIDPAVRALLRHKGIEVANLRIDATFCSVSPPERGEA